MKSNDNKTFSEISYLDSTFTSKSCYESLLCFGVNRSPPSFTKRGSFILKNRKKEEIPSVRLEGVSRTYVRPPKPTYTDLNSSFIPPQCLLRRSSSEKVLSPRSTFSTYVFPDEKYESVAPRPDEFYPDFRSPSVEYEVIQPRESKVATIRKNLRRCDSEYLQPVQTKFQSEKNILKGFKSPFNKRKNTITRFQPDTQNIYNHNVEYANKKLKPRLKPNIKYPLGVSKPNCTLLSSQVKGLNIINKDTSESLTFNTDPFYSSNIKYGNSNSKSSPFGHYSCVATKDLWYNKLSQVIVDEREKEPPSTTIQVTHYDPLSNTDIVSIL